MTDKFNAAMRDYLDKHPYGSHVVCLRQRYSSNDKWHNTTEYLSFDGLDYKGDPVYAWDNDWWEGQKEVELMGAIPLDGIHIEGFPVEIHIKQIFKGEHHESN